MTVLVVLSSVLMRMSFPAFLVCATMFVVADPPLPVRVATKGLLVLVLLHTGAHLEATTPMVDQFTSSTPLPDFARQCPLASSNLTDVSGWGTVRVGREEERVITMAESMDDLGSMSVVAAFHHVFVRREAALGLFVGAVVLTGWP